MYCSFKLAYLQGYCELVLSVLSHLCLTGWILVGGLHTHCSVESLGKGPESEVTRLLAAMLITFFFIHKFVIFENLQLNFLKTKIISGA